MTYFECSDSSEKAIYPTIMTYFECSDSSEKAIYPTNINECYCGNNLDCPKEYSNGDRYNDLTCCINDYCGDPTSDICRNLYTVVGLTIGMIFLCCVGAFIFFFCFYRRQRLQREYAIANSVQSVRRPELIDFGQPGMPAKRWEVKKDQNSREYYVDHWNKTSTWIKPAELKALERQKSEKPKPPA